MRTNEYKQGRMFMGCFDHDSDLLLSIEKFAAEKAVSTGQVRVIGAVKKAVVSFYDQQKKEYFDEIFDQNLEVLACIGNISLKDGKPIAHMHALFGDEHGHTMGGHLRPGTIVFFAEIFIQELEGPELHRGYDEITGLPAWQL
jgi:uncharacterized protein